MQYVELDLHALKGMVPVELFGHTAFPPIGDAPLFLTLGGHDFYWFSLERGDSATRAEPGDVLRAELDARRRVARRPRR